MSVPPVGDTVDYCRKEDFSPANSKICRERFEIKTGPTTRGLSCSARRTESAVALLLFIELLSGQVSLHPVQRCSLLPCKINIDPLLPGLALSPHGGRARPIRTADEAAGRSPAKRRAEGRREAWRLIDQARKAFSNTSGESLVAPHLHRDGSELARLCKWAKGDHLQGQTPSSPGPTGRK